MSGSAGGASGDTGRETLWLSRAVERAPVESAFLGSVGLFGVPPALVFVLYAVARPAYFTAGYLLSIGFLTLFLLVAPYLVWYYDSVLLPSFFEEMATVVEPGFDLDAVSARYQSAFANYWWVPCVVTVPTIPVLMFGGRSFVRSHGLFGATDALFWAVLLALAWIAVFVSIGFVMVAVTIGVVRSFSVEDLLIDPLHPDGLGGMSAAGYLSIRTTVMVSLGSLLLPLQFQYVIDASPLLTGFVYVNGFLYAVAILASFAYPTLLINRRANALRERKLEELRTQYRTLKENSREPRFGAALDATDQETELKLQRVRQEYEDFQTVTLYPMEFTILVRLVGSVLLPLAFILVDTLLRPAVLRELLRWLG